MQIVGILATELNIVVSNDILITLSNKTTIVASNCTIQVIFDNEYTYADKKILCRRWRDKNPYSLSSESIKFNKYWFLHFVSLAVAT